MKISTIIKCLGGSMLVLTSVGTANARQLTPEEALQRAMSNTKGMRIPGTHQLKLSYAESIEGKDLVYVFNDSEQGFIVVGGDDNMEALLGYSDNGAFDYNTAPPALKWWFNQYANEALHSVESLPIENLGNTPQKAPEVSERAPIETLIKTKWGQNAPFNKYCPSISGYQCVTGCVATALAQIIKYYGYPNTGSGSNVYGWNGQALEYNFASANFNYAEMLDVYNDIFVPNGKVNATEEQENAVANLMFACGVAVNMNYNLQASSASDIYIPFALQEFFGYGKDAKFLKRSFFVTKDWEDLIYSELKEGRPVIYGGQTLSGGGHEFICDGYDGNGYFHINWGWEGLADGNYRLSSLLPDQQGTGGFDGGYDCSQSIVCGIEPRTSETTQWYPIYASGSISAEPAMYTDGTQSNDALYIHYNGIVANNSPAPIGLDFVIKAVSETGTEYYATTATHLNFSGASNGSVSGFSNFGPVYLPSKLPEGKYKCYLVIKTEDGGYQEILYPVIDSNYFVLDVDSNGTISCSEGEPIEKAVIRVTDIKVLTDLVSGQIGRFQIFIENVGEEEYAGTFTIKFFNVDEKDELSDDFTYRLSAIPAGYEIGISPTFTIPMKPGTYEMICFDKYGQPISDAVQVVIGDLGVESIISSSEAVDIYTSGGVLVKKAADRDYIMSLAKGLYVIKAGERTYKIIK